MTQAERAAALAAYESLRQSNPHLPPPNKVTPRGVTVDFGAEHSMPKVTLEVYVDIPDQWKWTA